MNLRNIAFGSFKINNIRIDRDDQKKQLVADLKSLDGVENVLKGEDIPETLFPMHTRFLFNKFDSYRKKIGSNDCVISSYYWTPFVTAQPELENKIVQALKDKGYNVET